MNLKKGLLLALIITLAVIAWQAYMVLSGISDNRTLLIIFCAAGLIELCVLFALIKKGKSGGDDQMSR